MRRLLIKAPERPSPAEIALVVCLSWLVLQNGFLMLLGEQRLLSGFGATAGALVRTTVDVLPHLLRAAVQVIQTWL